MSLNISIKAKREVEIFEANVTYNLSDMYYKCISGGLWVLDGMKCKQVIPILNNAISDLINNKEEYKKLNSQNGWGSYDGLLKTLKAMLECCEKNEDGIIEVE